MKEFLRERRRALYDLHKKGASGRHVVRELTELTDEVLTALYRSAVIHFEASTAEYIQEGVSLAAVGGYGRRELNPFSDMDILFLYDPSRKKAAEEISKEMLYFLWDLDFTVGYSLRTIDDALRIGYGDLTARTAMMESRLLAGSEYLFQEFQRVYYHKIIEKDRSRYVSELLSQIEKERRKFGSTVYILEPNIKRSEGGLRDIHYLQWVAFTCYGTYSLVELQKQGRLSSYDYNALTEAQNFLWILRNEMHFHAGKGSDVLTFREQKRLADFLQFENQPHLLAVEQFMQQYYRHSTAISRISARFIRKALPASFFRKLADRVMFKNISPCFRETRHDVIVPEKKRGEFLASGENILSLFRLSQKAKKPVSDDTLEMLRRGTEFRDASFFQSPRCKKLFMEILSEPGRIASTLRQMHQTGILGIFIPDFHYVNRLMQYNVYHKYTVDEHLIRTVEEAESLAGETGVIAQVYKMIQRKDLLHLALLLHDIGKGRPGDHTDWGVEIGKKVNSWLGLSAEESDTVLFLIRNHLMMSNIALRRDLGDEKVLIEFARHLGQAETLKLLFLLTYADIKGVGPEALTDWKRGLLQELYQKTIEFLQGVRTESSAQERIDYVHKTIEKDLLTVYSPEEVSGIFKSLPRRVLFSLEPARLLTFLLRIKALESDSVLVDVLRFREKKTAEVTVYTLDSLTPGIFSKISGVLAANGIQIIGAQVHTTLKGIVVDSFQVNDPDTEDVHFEERWSGIKKDIRAVLKGEVSVGRLFEKTERSAVLAPVLQPVPVIVEFDNNASLECTVVDIFASDRQGLLYVIAGEIFNLGLSVYTARIATRLDQIVDVFYVKDRDGGKITDPVRLQEIRERLLTAIESYCNPS